MCWKKAARIFHSQSLFSEFIMKKKYHPKYFLWPHKANNVNFIPEIYSVAFQNHCSVEINHRHFPSCPLKKKKDVNFKLCLTGECVFIPKSEWTFLYFPLLLIFLVMRVSLESLDYVSWSYISEEWAYLLFLRNEWMLPSFMHTYHSYAGLK